MKIQKIQKKRRERAAAPLRKIVGEMMRIRRAFARVDAWCVKHTEMPADADMQAVLRAASEVMKQPLAALIGRGRWAEICTARAVVIVVMTDDFGMVSKDIGLLLHRDGSAVRYAYKQACGWLDVDEGFRKALDQVRRLIDVNKLKVTTRVKV